MGPILASFRERLAGIRPLHILVASFGLAIAYAFPGYLNWDSGDQLFQSREGTLDDWHPPIMGAYWHAIEYVVRGPFGMLVLQLSLFLWGLYRVLAMRFPPRTAALVASALVLFPPVLTPMAAVWKDAQMAGFLVAGTMLALRPSWWARGVGLGLLMLAAGVRDNGIAAVPPLAILIVASWGLRRRLRVIAAAVVVVVVLVVVAAFANRAATQTRAYAWFRTVAIYDLAGTICHEDPMTDAEVREVLEGIPMVRSSELQANMCRQYKRVWFELIFSDNAVFNIYPDKPERIARRRAWVRILREHTHAFLSHRWRVMKEVLGLTDSEPWEPVNQMFAANPDHLQRISHAHSLSSLQQTMGDWFTRKLSRTLLYRPWAYALVALILCGYAIRRRDLLVVSILGSGLLYEASLFIGAAAPDFRYSHWMVTCCCVATAIIFGERLRAGIEARLTASERDPSRPSS